MITLEQFIHLGFRPESYTRILFLKVDLEVKGRQVLAVNHLSSYQYILGTFPSHEEATLAALTLRVLL